MNDDYLWDRTGEPDPEIQQLEEVLGTMRYQAQPLELPAGTRPGRERRYFPRLAVAAAIALMILSAGLWVRMHRLQTPGPGEMATKLPHVTEPKKDQATASPIPVPVNRQMAGNVDKVAPERKTRLRNRKLASPGDSLVRKVNRPRDVVVPPVELTAEQRNEGLEAKEQLMLALRLASAKLNLAQRKTQGPPAPSTIRNQHRVG